MSHLQSGATRAFRFEAEPPTTTLQRLKALTTGSPPTFFDVGNSFTPGALDEDNLVHQFQRRILPTSNASNALALLGDVSWSQLFPAAFDPELSAALACYNIHDLHSVDDGVLAALPGLLGRPERWGAAVLHFLGADHAGHAHGVQSPEMRAKLRQLDSAVESLAEAMAERASPGEPFHRTLLLVCGDHGQTLSGEHGGGSAEEVDSALIALHVGAWRLARQNAPRSAPNRLVALPAVFADPCRFECACGPEANQCVPDLPQVDLVPAAAALLGLSVPFGNLGRLSPELWSLGQALEDVQGGNDAQKDVEERLKRCADAASDNADQVLTYLRAYAARASFPLAAVERAHAAHRAAAEAAPAEALGAALAFLENAAELSRAAWTQFRVPSMAAGLLLLLLSLLLQAAQLREEGFGAGGTSRHRSALCLAALCLVHAAGIFSFFFLLSEGQATCLLALAALPLWALSHRSTFPGSRLFPLLGAMASLALGSRLGSAHHTGQGFWHRLTVHPEDVQVREGFSGWRDLLEGAARATSRGLVRWLRACFRGWAPAGLLSAIVWDLLPCAVVLACAARSLLARLDASGRRLHLGLSAAVFVSVLAYRASRCEPLLAWLDAEGWGHASALAARACYAALALQAAALFAVARRPASATPLGARSVQWALVALLLLLGGEALPIVNLCGLALVASLKLVVGNAGDDSAALGKPAALKSAAAASGLLVALLQPVFFFATGHLCEFAGLRWTAGFVGFSEFDLVRGAVLVAVDTFGCWALGMCLLAQLLEPVLQEGTGENKRALRYVALASLSLARVSTAVAATTSAAVQRRHLYVWALFAPRFVFEALFLLLADVGGLVLLGR